MLNFLLNDTAPEVDPGACDTTQIFMLIAIGVMLVLFVVWSTISKRKQGKQMNDMRSTMRVGDVVMTIGGIIGTVIEVNEKSANEKEFVIETGAGSNKSTMRFDFRALGENRTRIKEVQAEAAKRAEEQRIAKELKKNPDYKPAKIEEEPQQEIEAEVEVSQDTPENNETTKE